MKEKPPVLAKRRYWRQEKRSSFWFVHSVMSLDPGRSFPKVEDMGLSLKLLFFAWFAPLKLNTIECDNERISQAITNDMVCPYAIFMGHQ